MYIEYVFNTFARFAVPFFFVAAGYLFGTRVRLGESGVMFRYTKDYLKKLASVYIAWQLLYILYDLTAAAKGVLFSDAGPIAELAGHVLSIRIGELIYYSRGNSGYHLWFLPALMLSILVIYLFQRMKAVDFLFSISCFLHLFGLFGQSYSGFLSVPFPQEMPYFLVCSTLLWDS